MIDNNASTVPTHGIQQLVTVFADTAEVRTRLTACLTSAGFAVCPVESLESLAAASARHVPGLVCCELSVKRLGDLPQLKLASRGAQILLIGDAEQVEAAGKLATTDAFALVNWPLAETGFLVTVQRALEQHRLRQETFTLREQIAMHFGFDNVIGNSDIIMSLKASAQRVANTDIPVMLTGPSGSGKNLLARTIHYHSPRRYNQFQLFDCSVIPPDIQEAELFGETTPDGSRPGLLEKSDCGTLLIDNVDRMAEALQVRLQQFLQTQKLTRPADNRTLKLDIRFLSATAVDPAEIISRRLLREELFYRLNVVTLTVPSLVARRGDIPMLTEYFLRSQADHAATFEGFSEEALELMERHNWPGNVRELQSTVKRAAAMARGPLITEREISFLGDSAGTGRTRTGPLRSTLTIKGGLLDTGQRSLIVKALNDNDWNYTRTAAELGIGRTTLWRKIKKYKLAPEVVGEEVT
jgi:DNA-binding NtrC family response regulator